MANLWNDYDFRWGGNYSGTKDWMHFEFMGSVNDAARMTEKAMATLGGDDELTKDEQALLQYVKGFKKFFDQGPMPSEPGPVREGWNDAQKTVTQPKPEGE
jgi:hypothetical protein